MRFATIDSEDENLDSGREDFLAEVTDIAYRAVLEQGLQRPFVEVELDLWRRIRSAYRARGELSLSLLEVA